MLRTTLSISIVLFSFLLPISNSFATFIPDEDIKDRFRVYDMRDSNITEQQFNEIIDKAYTMYEPIVSGQGATLDVQRLWTDETPNASASQMGTTWTVNMYGGLARHPEMSGDGFAMVMCHELGHHLAGYTFRKSWFPFGGTWASNEGQSDYFASHSCARELWKNEVDINATFRATVPPVVQADCDAIWTEVAQQDLCYRINAAGMVLAKTLAALGKETTQPSYDTPDMNQVSTTNHKHPKAQCRMDTTLSASLCTVTFDQNVIPAKSLTDQFGVEAEKEASLYTCMESGNYVEGLRPRCWFKSAQ